MAKMYLYYLSTSFIVGFLLTKYLKPPPTIPIIETIAIIDFATKSSSMSGNLFITHKTMNFIKVKIAMKIGNVMKRNALVQVAIKQISNGKGPNQILKISNPVQITLNRMTCNIENPYFSQFSMNLKVICLLPQKLSKKQVDL